jgi:ABC-type bacteriocin/lantibiotic exporter with double-glycine peptidase domain
MISNKSSILFILGMICIMMAISTSLGISSLIYLPITIVVSLLVRMLFDYINDRKRGN